MFFIPIIYSNNYSNLEFFEINSDGFAWPLPQEYTYISSYFGSRISPTTGASSYHYGIDIPAPEGTKFIAINDRRNYFY